MNVKDKLAFLKDKEDALKKGAGEAAIAKIHSSGCLTARERIELFFDQGSFVELDMLQIKLFILTRKNNERHSC